MKEVKKSKTPISKTKRCDACKKDYVLSNFYNTNSPLSVDGKLNICKKCISKMIDCTNLDSIYKVLQLMDVPFIYDYWEIAKEKNPINPWNIYIRMANSGINDFKNATWSHSVFSSKKADYEDRLNNTLRKDEFEVSDEIIEFFGAGYSNEEYKAMYRKYDFLKNNYPEKTNMHIEALKTYVRFKVKEEMSVASGQVGEAAKWADLANKAAQNAKINPSQLSAADLQDGLTTFGQLSRAVEQAIDIIAILPKFKERPQDKVDFALWCYINYIRDLKGLQLCDYKDIWKFYEDRVKENQEKFDFLQDRTEMIESDGENNG